MALSFTLSPRQEERVKSWSTKHAKEVHSGGDGIVKDMTGVFLQFTFMPTGMGENCKVECVHCKQGVNLTEDFDSGDFLYNEDGTKNGW